MNDLFSNVIEICAGMHLLPSYADSSELQQPLNSVLAISPLRQMVTSRGFSMSVHTSNCGDAGWVSDRRGYRYVNIDPLTGQPWPAMPVEFTELAQSAASYAGFSGFVPDACLINHYQPGTQMGAQRPPHKARL